MFVGRGAERARIAHALTAPDCAVLVVGEPGIGKTRLVVEAARDAGVALREGGGLATLSWMPYLPLRRAFGDIGARTRWGGDPESAAARVEARLGGDVLFADDLHWWDRGTLDAVAILAGRVPIVVASRAEGEGVVDAVGVLTGRGFRVIELGALGAADSVRLARAARPGISDLAAESAASHGGGNPLAVEELARGGESERGLARAISARVRALDDGARHDLGMLALAVRALPAEDVATATRLVGAGLAAVRDGMVEIRHPFLGQLVRDGLDESVGRVLHAELATLSADPGEAAQHWRLAGRRERAYASALVAVETAATPGERSAHLVTAALCGTDQAGPDLLLRAAGAAVEAGDYAACRDILASLPDEPGLRAHACWLRACAARESGELDEWARWVEAGRRTVPAGAPVRVALLAESARVALQVAQDPRGALAIAEEAVELARRVGRHQAAAMAVLGAVRHVRGEPLWQHIWPDALQRAVHEHDLVTEMSVGSSLVSAHESSGDPAEAARVADAMIARAERSGLQRWRRHFAALRVNLAMHAGDATAVDRMASRMLAEPLMPRSRATVASAWGMALLGLARYDDALALARDELDGSLFASDAHHVRAAAFDAVGRPHRALEEWGPFLAADPGPPRLALAAPVFAWVALHAGAVPLPSPDAGAAYRVPMLRSVPVELDAIGRLRRGEVRGAVACLDAAAGLWAPYHKPGELRCRIAAAEALVDRDARAALARLDVVEAIAAPLGQRAALTDVARLRRALGVRTGASTTRDGALTEREREVLDLVMRGLADAAIAVRLGISARTVETHLGTARRKLGAATRDQAAALAVQP